ncbi:hypothetical protein DFH08DRAFT_798328 [Mycena albidolilacea]|uniref:Uncharacterized protein n=1 Tax=Mycena albidolilacea TaxID=1033008 RepID=A0AAD7F3B5_9AGAR|nr:hypothetical protein DFH08DRAFT_798328 [Mycena albidolilacea]
MPSEIVDSELHTQVCAPSLPDIEVQMREGEALEALKRMRAGLCTRTMTNHFKVRNFTDQGLMTKSQGILHQINVLIHNTKLRYRPCQAGGKRTQTMSPALLGRQEALTQTLPAVATLQLTALSPEAGAPLMLYLEGHGAWEERLRILHDDNVHTLNEHVLMAEEKAYNAHWVEVRGTVVEGGIARAGVVAAGEGSHTLSWIWYMVGEGETDKDKRLVDAVTKIMQGVFSHAPEMWCTVAYGITEVGEWERRATEELPGTSAELTEGRQVYAAEHAATERACCADLEHRWWGILQKADVYLDGGDVTAAAQEVTVKVDLADELDPEEEEARLEGEEDQQPSAAAAHPDAGKYSEIPIKGQEAQIKRYIALWDSCGWATQGCKKVPSVLMTIGDYPKNTWDTNSWNTYQMKYCIEHPWLSKMTSEELQAYAKAREDSYNTLFALLSDNEHRDPEARHLCVKLLMKWHREKTMQVVDNRKADGGRKALMNKAVVPLIHQSTAVSNSLNIEIFGLVLDCYGDNVIIWGGGAFFQEVFKQHPVPIRKFFIDMKALFQMTSLYLQNQAETAEAVSMMQPVPITFTQLPQRPATAMRYVDNSQGGRAHERLTGVFSWQVSS